MESDTQTRIIKWLNTIGAYVIKTISANKNGIPDILCCYEGRFYGFEVKSEKGRATALQKYNIDQIRAAGGVGEVVKTVEEVKCTLKKYMKI